MPQTTYAGRWLAHSYRDPAQAVLHVSDPAHSDTSTVPDNASVYAAPPLAAVAELGQYPGAEWLVITPGHDLDHTDYTGHGQGETMPALVNDQAASAASATMHSDDQGAARELAYAQPPMTFATDHYGGERISGLNGAQVSDTALRRGLNSDPVNNPEGFRLGEDYYPFVDHDLTPPQRVHDAHVLTPNVATVATDTPPTAVPYGSPFSSMARAIHDTWSAPSVRREPQPIDEAITTDGQDTAYPASLDSWVVG